MPDDTKILDAFNKHNVQELARRKGMGEGEVKDLLNGKGDYKQVTEMARDFVKQCEKDAKRWREK